MWLELGQDYLKIERKTYSLLEWVGDVGGLFDGLLIIFSSLLGSLASFTLKEKILSLVFKLESDKRNSSNMTGQVKLEN